MKLALKNVEVRCSVYVIYLRHWQFSFIGHGRVYNLWTQTMFHVGNKRQFKFEIRTKFQSTNVKPIRIFAWRRQNNNFTNFIIEMGNAREASACAFFPYLLKISLCLIYQSTQLQLSPKILVNRRNPCSSAFTMLSAWNT